MFAVSVDDNTLLKGATLLLMMMVPLTSLALCSVHQCSSFGKDAGNMACIMLLSEIDTPAQLRETTL